MTKQDRSLAVAGSTRRDFMQQTAAFSAAGAVATLVVLADPHITMVPSLLDEAKRTELYGEMQSLIRDEGGAVVPLFPHQLHVAVQNLRHGKIAGDRYLDGARSAGGLPRLIASRPCPPS